MSPSLVSPGLLNIASLVFTSFLCPLPLLNIWSSLPLSLSLACPFSKLKPGHLMTAQKQETRATLYPPSIYLPVFPHDWGKDSVSLVTNIWSRQSPKPPPLPSQLTPVFLFTVRLILVRSASRSPASYHWLSHIAFSFFLNPSHFGFWNKREHFLGLISFLQETGSIIAFGLCPLYTVGRTPN